MELTEVVSPSVAVPVLCVLVCAFLVFAFGFKSPAQPPSFDVFDEDGKKKKSKKSKGSKSQSNGHAVIASEGDASSNAKPQASPRQVTKQSVKAQPTVTKSKVPAQTAQEPVKKVKKQIAKEEDVKQPAKKQEVIEDADVEGWHTVPKKDKKQKKKETEAKQDRQDSPAKEEEIVKSAEAVGGASEVAVEEAPGSPQEQRNKKKKDKKNKKAKSDEEVVEQMKVEMQVVKETAASVVVAEPEPEVIDASIEMQIQDAMETTVGEENGTGEKKKRNKKEKKKALPTPEEDDFVIPQAALEQPVLIGEPEPAIATPLKENTDALTVKIPKKKQKKDRNKKSEERLPESLEIGASGGVDSSLSNTFVSESQPKKTKLKDTSIKEEPPVIESSPGAEGGAASEDTSSPPSAATFDELGGMTESWTEAKPKSKKKKARRAD